MKINEFEFKLLQNQLSKREVDIYYSGNIIFADYGNDIKFVLNDIINKKDNIQEVINWCKAVADMPNP